MVEDIGALTVGEETLLKMWRVTLSSFKRVLQRHSHTRFEITVVERGAGSYTTPAGVLPMRAGDVFVFAGNEPHCITAVEDEGLSIVNLHFEPRYLFGRAGDTLSERHLDFCFAHAPDFSNRIPAERAEKLCSLHGEVAKELQEKRDEYALAVKSLLNLMLIALIRDHGYAAASGDGAGVRGVLRAMHYIDRHLCEKLTLADIAAQAGCSRPIFRRFFGAITPCPFGNTSRQGGWSRRCGAFVRRIFRKPCCRWRSAAASTAQRASTAPFGSVPA